MKQALFGFVLAASLFVGGTAIAQQKDTGDGDVADQPVMVAPNLATVELGDAIFDLDANGPSYGCSIEMQP